jgi:hypothetical protein
MFSLRTDAARLLSKRASYIPRQETRRQIQSESKEAYPSTKTSSDQNQHAGGVDILDRFMSQYEAAVSSKNDIGQYYSTP